MRLCSTRLKCCTTSGGIPSPRCDNESYLLVPCRKAGGSTDVTLAHVCREVSGAKNRAAADVAAVKIEFGEGCICVTALSDVGGGVTVTMKREEDMLSQEQGESPRR
ncbi:hypothetical protein HBH56_096930 [Parastagonospora nodorum]|uniref:Uncharacterized protein n=1 Tax=Phaeosphaeria nodorum (strain SN15 / ATCC MYA-4574 / FGSC 10173) TaxID=321614 RepID=A0A7U2ICT2_PHANO|nr:hypothetical protein HBH56_096930 [Parastagonospora nodorum]QRD07280.1 hypothetical protein JI435_447170 [Parastagonospora nodorum SN15]KAH3930281.1 hypothetical protein HBH54_111250 [Parastagonospora nodorum]KAH4026891.1 hypothetical protein HBI09_145420 [Parastagonospora nodorum]KAH4118501.1 hypothetical protein HBH47_140160 [Parastagonospora nodorum]